MREENLKQWIMMKRLLAGIKKVPTVSQEETIRYYFFAVISRLHLTQGTGSILPLREIP